MAGKQLAGDGLSANFTGMSKNQLYDIMSQMKALIEQNQQQARQILIQNPPLTKALFQAQITLGMVQTPKAIPSIPPSTAQPPQAALTVPGQIGLQDQTSASQPLNPLRKQQPNQPLMPVTSHSAPHLNVQSQPLPSHPSQSVQQPMGHRNGQATAMSLPQSSQVNNNPLPPIPSASQKPSLQPPMPTAYTRSQQPLNTSGIAHMQLQPPLPPQPRPPSMPAFGHQMRSQIGSSAGFQHSGAPQMHHSQPTFHSGQKHPVSMGHSFSQAHPMLPTLPTQPPHQSHYQGGGSHLGMDISQVGSSMQAERGSSWMPGLRDNSTVTHLPGPPPFIGGQTGPGSQPPRPSTLTPDMETALLQQVMSLTPEQINLLPQEQRNQVLQLQQMLRK